MCTNCVNRLFNEGPNQCPYAGCHRTLRRKGFRSAFFGDLAVEREVDIRRRVAAVFNAQPEDFETLRHYNDYLQMVEDLTFDLVFSTSGSPNSRKRKADAEARLREYEAQHREEIERNRRAGRDADERTSRRLAQEAELARRRRLEAMREEEEERLARERLRDEVMDSLQKGQAQGEKAAQETIRRIVLKKRGQPGQRFRDKLLDELDGSGTTTTPKLSIRGLKDRTTDGTGRRRRRTSEADEDRGPYDPFAGLDLTPTRYSVKHLLRGHQGYQGHGNDWLDRAARDDAHRVAGYSVDEYVTRAMFEAFAGLGVFVLEEKAEAAVPAGAPPPTAGGVREKEAAAAPMEVDG